MRLSAILGIVWLKGLRGEEFEPIIVVSVAVDVSRLPGGGDVEGEMPELPDGILPVDEGIGVLSVEKGLKSKSLSGSVTFLKRRIDLRKVGLSTAQFDD